MAVRIGDAALTQPKAFTAGTHRARDPAETVAALRPLMSRFGITRLANVTGLDCIGLPVYVAVRPNSRSLSTSQGKGLTEDAARASALMESIEGWHAEHIVRPLRHDSYESLRRTVDVVDVTRLPRREHDEIRLDAPMLWIEGHDLLHDGRPTWVPFETVTLNFVRSAAHAPTFRASSNGLASGNHLLEAIAHGLCEVIERDAMTMWDYADEPERKRWQLDVATVADRDCRAVLEGLERAGVEAVLWDATSDLGVPTFACRIFEREERAAWRRIGPASGWGTHLAPGIAALRALTEAVQSRLTYISGSRDDAFYADYDAFTREGSGAAQLERARNPPPSRAFGDVVARATPTFEGDVEVTLAALRAGGVESAVVVDLTQPGIGVPVVKVVVPGLEARVASEHYVPGARARAFLAARAEAAR